MHELECVYSIQCIHIASQGSKDASRQDSLTPLLLRALAGLIGVAQRATLLP